AEKVRGAQERGKRRRVERTASDSMDRTAASRRPKKAHEGLPCGQNARLRTGIEKETEGVALVSTRHSAPQFPLPPYTRAQTRPRSAPMEGAKAHLVVVLEVHDARVPVTRFDLEAHGRLRRRRAPQVRDDAARAVGPLHGRVIRESIPVEVVERERGVVGADRQREVAAL